MEPAQTIISLLGGPKAVSSAVGVHRTRVSNWKRPKAAGGTDGLIPQRHHRTLLDLAESKDVPLCADDFLPAKVDAAA